jgi:hypothetical protein
VGLFRRDPHLAIDSAARALQRAALRAHVVASAGREAQLSAEPEAHQFVVRVDGAVVGTESMSDSVRVIDLRTGEPLRLLLSHTVPTPPAEVVFVHPQLSRIFTLAPITGRVTPATP